MAVEATRYSRISTGYHDKVNSLSDYDAADTSADFSCVNGQASGTFGVTGALTQTGAATFSSTVSVGGNLTASAGVFVGNAAAVNELVSISAQTVSVAFGVVSGHEYSTVTVGVSNATRGDTILFQPDSNWTGFGLALSAQVSGTTAGEVDFTASNVTSADIGQSAVVFRFIRIAHPSYI